MADNSADNTLLNEGATGDTNKSHADGTAKWSQQLVSFFKGAYALLKDPQQVSEIHPLPVDTPRTIFDETLTAEFTPVAAVKFPYNIPSGIVSSETNNGGTVTQAAGLAVVSTSAAANAHATMRTNRVIHYNPGQGIELRLGAIFSTGVADSEQWAGLIDEADGFAFGYQASTFGILRRTSGARETQTLTITTASSTAQDITITLDGDALATVTVTTSGVISTTANEIAAAANDYSEVGGGWKACVEGDTVVFTAFDSDTHAGAFTLSSATTAVGTFAQSVAAAAPSETFTSQDTWNLDNADGTEHLPTLVPTNGNVYKIEYQWLGFGQVVFSIEDPVTGRFEPVHRIEYSNSATVPSLLNPSVPVSAMARNVANTSDIAVKISSLVAGVQGKNLAIGNEFAADVQGTGFNTTESPLVSVLNQSVFASITNRTIQQYTAMSLGNVHNQNVIVRFYKNAVLTGPSFTEVSAGQSVMTIDESATAFSGGEFLFGVYVGVLDSKELGLDQLQGHDRGIGFNPGDMMTATVETVSGTGAAVEIAMRWVELQ